MSVRTPLKYPGGKQRIAEWIINQFPEHHSYVEPYFGSGAVLFNKESANIETVNDLDDRVINLFECIKEDAEKLASIIELTPYSRKIYDLSYTKQCTDKFDMAAQFLIKSWQGHGFRSNEYKVGWRNDVQGRESAYALRNWNRVPQYILKSVERLKSVQIECRPALELIERQNFKNVLIYADPPYLHETRSGKQYMREMSVKDHVYLLDVLLDHKGPVALSGYDSKLYNETLKGWRKEKKISNAEYYKGACKIECLWMNYDPVDSQLKMFV